MRIRNRIWEIVEVAQEGDTASRVFDISIILLIFLNIVAVIIETIENVRTEYGEILRDFEIFSVSVFTLEYILRIWSCVAKKEFSKPIRGRLKFATQPMPIIDLLAILPFYIPLIGIDLRFVRILRFLRVLRIVKIGRYYSKLQLIIRVFDSKKEELILSTAIMGILLVISASLMYYCENPVQPDVFSSIPATMWWAIATLTTVGYGDIYPITPLCKLFASIIAVLGIGMFALPTAILGAGFVDEIQEIRKNNNQEITCPHCGRRIA